VAIGTNDLVEKFGTLTSVDDASTSSVANAAFSVAADISAWTNTDDVPQAMFVLKAQWATVTNVANKLVNIYARPINIQSTNDPVAPSANRLATCIGSFTVYAASGSTDYFFESTRCDLPNLKSGQEYEFYIENQTGQTIAAGWALWIMPVTQGPKA
jgi:hypothetical protein